MIGFEGRVAFLPTKLLALADATRRSVARNILDMMDYHRKKNNERLTKRKRKKRIGNQG